MIAAKNEYCHFCGQYHPEWLEGCKNEPIIKQNIKMRKFKHKPTGEIFVQKNDLEMIGLKDSESNGLTLPTWLLEQGNDWEEIKEEPNYLITAFRDLRTDPKEICRLSTDGTYGNCSINRINLKDVLTNGYCVESGYFEIYSVKNSKGEEFTIGDKCNFGVIKSFEIDRIWIGVEIEGIKHKYSLQLIEKLKTPIYTTTDGLEIFKGDKVRLFLLHKDYKTVQDCATILSFNSEDKKVADRYLSFVSDENRDKYIKEHTRKPIFVSADNVEMFEGDFTFSVLSRNTWEEKRFRVSSFTADMNKDWIHFHTKEARQEYIDNNKPKYSLADIKKAFTAPHHSPLYIGFKANLKALDK